MASLRHYNRPNDHAHVEAHPALHQSHPANDNAEHASKPSSWPRLPSLPFTASHRPPMQQRQDSLQDQSFHQHYPHHPVNLALPPPQHTTRNPLQQHLDPQHPHHCLLPPPPSQERRAKRGKPMARRSLQKLFDAAADDSTTWRSTSSGGDFDDEDADTACGSANSSQTELCYPLSHDDHGTTTQSTPPSSSLYRMHHGLCQNGSSSLPTSPAPSSTTTTTTTTTTSIPLLHLLTSEQGSQLTLSEIKAILYRIAQDLHDLHSSNKVHCSVSLNNVSLLCCDDMAVAVLNPGSEGVAAPSRSSPLSRWVWASRDPRNEAYTAPETANCPADHSPFTTQSDVYALGVILFVLLSGGSFPFGKEGLCSEGSPVPCAAGRSVDEMQRCMKGYLLAQIQSINEACKACRQEDNERGSEETPHQQQGTSTANAECLQILGFDPDATSLSLSMLHADPAQRPTMAVLLSHPWLVEVAELVPKLSSFLPEKRMTSNSGTANSDSLANTTTIMMPGDGGAMTPAGAMDADERDAKESTQCSVASKEESMALSLDAVSLHGASSGSNAECPYPVIGHVSQPLKMTVDGSTMLVSAVHAVYAVPGHGAMMSAVPMAMIPLAPSSRDTSH